jgi:hypothetical protein
MVNILLQKNNTVEHMLDLYAWFWLQAWFMPHYIIGKQDTWKEWVGSSLNGWKVGNICRP